MRYTIYIILLTVFTTACHTIKRQTTNPQGLQTKIGLGSPPFSKDKVQITFTVINKTDKPVKFCKWETPFEPRLGKYFELIDEQGKEAEFKGAMARRVMPPPPEAYIEVPAHDSVRTVYNLADHYTFTGTKYTLTYTGVGVSGLDAGNKIKFSFSN